LEVNADELRRELRKAGVKSVKVERIDQTTLAVSVPTDQREKLVEIVGPYFPNWTLEVSEPPGGDVLVQRLVLVPEEVRRIKEPGVEQTLETIRNRIDQFGVPEPLTH